MRIAMLYPSERETPAWRDDSPRAAVTRLTEGLRDRGVDVTLFPQAHHGASRPSDGEVAECLRLSELFERSDDFDLIHNHQNFFPLAFTQLVSTPLLSTIYGTPSSEALLVYAKYNGQVFYVSTSESDRAPGLDYIATISQGDRRTVDDYLKVYHRILEIRQREDHRPWGFYIILSDAPDHKIKRINVFPGKRLSLQRHRRRSEHWHVIAGEALVTIDDQHLRLGPGESVDIPMRSRHRIENRNSQNLVFIEIQRGEYFGEDDIERFEDDFGRA